MRSSGAHVAATLRANSAACPPCEWPQAANVVPADSAGMVRAARTMSTIERPSLSPTR